MTWGFFLTHKHGIEEGSETHACAGREEDVEGGAAEGGDKGRESRVSALQGLIGEWGGGGGRVVMSICSDRASGPFIRPFTHTFIHNSLIHSFIHSSFI